MEEPKTLLEAVRHFEDHAHCVEFIVAYCWDGKLSCLRCGSLRMSQIKGRPTMSCKDCRYQQSIKVGTIFEKSPLPLSKWLPTVWLVANAKNAISSHEIGRAIGVTQKTAWFMAMRIREAVCTRNFKKLSGSVETDESYIGGREVFRHWDKKTGKVGGADKTAVWGAVERDGGRVVAKVITSQKVPDIQAEVLAHVDTSAKLYSDELTAYKGVGKKYASHGIVNHGEREYVKGDAHTNTIEAFWSLFKRGLKGTHIHVAPFHVDRYLDDQSFRYNHRKRTDSGRFQVSMSQIRGRRLTWNQLTGKAI
jgi:transposase-like protein